MKGSGPRRRNDRISCSGKAEGARGRCETAPYPPGASGESCGAVHGIARCRCSPGAARRIPEHDKCEPVALPAAVDPPEAHKTKARRHDQQYAETPNNRQQTRVAPTRAGCCGIPEMRTLCTSESRRARSRGEEEVSARARGQPHAPEECAFWRRGLTATLA